MESNTICGRGKDRVMSRRLIQKTGMGVRLLGVCFVCLSACACLWACVQYLCGRLGACLNHLDHYEQCGSSDSGTCQNKAKMLNY